MKVLTTLAAVCLAVTLAGCSTTSDTETSSLGAVSECSAADCDKAGCDAKTAATCGDDCTEPCCNEASPGAVKDAPHCGGGNASECPYSGGGASLGAVSEAKDSGCCPSQSKSSCSEK